MTDIPLTPAERRDAADAIHLVRTELRPLKLDPKKMSDYFRKRHEDELAFHKRLKELEKRLRSK